MSSEGSYVCGLSRRNGLNLFRVFKAHTTAIYFYIFIIFRWFDKSVQLIVCRNGLSGIHFEHAWGDGVAVLRFFNEIYKDSTENATCSTSQLAGLDLAASTYRKLDFTIPSSVQNKINTAKEKFEKRVNSLDMDTVQMSSFGREYLRRKKISPDAVMQLAFQVRSSV